MVKISLGPAAKTLATAPRRLFKSRKLFNHLAHLCLCMQIHDDLGVLDAGTIHGDVCKCKSWLNRTSRRNPIVHSFMGF